MTQPTSDASVFNNARKRTINGLADPDRLDRTDETERNPDSRIVHEAVIMNDVISTATSCPYLDTIQRSVLDFDYEATCSITLETGPHIYACLVCGKYFRGRGSQTPAYIHSVNESHYIFCHLQNGTFHCIPDGYEVRDPSLNDIRDALHPTYTEADIEDIDSNTELSRDIFGRLYLPGFVGLNNPNKTDCINAVVQALAHVRPIRDFFLLQNDNPTSTTGTLGPATKIVSLQAFQVTRCFGELVRKIWSNKRFKSHVDPHKLINAIAAASKNKYRIGQQQMELGEFMSWFIHQLHLGTGGSLTNRTKLNKKRKSTTPVTKSIVEQTFQGKVRVTTRQAKRKTLSTSQVNDSIEDDRAGSDPDDDAAPNDEETRKTSHIDNDGHELCVEETVMDSHFLQLTLDISEKPLFRDEDGGLVIPQEPLVTVLQKFDGVTFSDAISRGVVQRRKYNILQLPNYLVLHFARFKTNQYSRVKNPTIVAFPVKNMDLSNYVESTANQQSMPSEEEVRKMNVS
jgi:U4/U6.U5 tri-snRNP-associated protein 2